MKYIDFSKALSMVCLSASGKPLDFAYQKYTGNCECEYVLKDDSGEYSPGCIIGDAFLREGIVGVDFFMDYDPNIGSLRNTANLRFLITALADKHCRFTDKAAEFLANVQTLQDDNVPWYKAIVDSVAYVEESEYHDSTPGAMTTLGELPVPVTLTRNEVRLIHGMIMTRRTEPAPGLLELADKLGFAEVRAINDYSTQLEPTPSAGTTAGGEQTETGL